ncbi:excalibur calcium-binding domain-containing protein [Pseudoxanthomonas sp. UTMC 1351]|uniref:excalibur calcium-binding domain-containing protein n=1 Tax=Pseudoxanthomonas sp. UTMC 1351 TaxID=2695853 RepID=UPI0034D016AE
MKCVLMIWVLSLAAAPAAWAHGGGLNKDGCHNDRKNGGYHCHRGGGSFTVAPARDIPRDDLAPAPFAPPRNAPGGAFANCAEARAAGAAPVRRGQPGYGTHLDRDNDGVGCEPYRRK